MNLSWEDCVQQWKYKYCNCTDIGEKHEKYNAQNCNTSNYFSCIQNTNKIPLKQLKEMFVGLCILPGCDNVFF